MCFVSFNSKLVAFVFTRLTRHFVSASDSSCPLGIVNAYARLLLTIAKSSETRPICSRERKEGQSDSFMMHSVHLALLFLPFSGVGHRKTLLAQPLKFTQPNIRS